MKKLLSILFVAAMFVACGGEKKSSDSDETNQKSEVGAKYSNSYADNALKHLDRMLSAVEANNYDAFKNAYYALYLLDGETSDEVKRDAKPILDANQEKYMDRFNEYAYRFESWVQRALNELEEEGLLIY